jgi:catechol 2,3-dioxygenase-like lactoylglutathione lyase family enzyme
LPRFTEIDHAWKCGFDRVRADARSQKARRFYEKTLGLEFVSEDPFALVFNAHGVVLRIANVSTVEDFRPAPFTILGWRVSSAEKTVRALREKGIEFERFPGRHQNPLGIWHSPSGAQVAWFKDPDGNILSITEI